MIPLVCPRLPRGLLEVIRLGLVRECEPAVGPLRVRRWAEPVMRPVGHPIQDLVEAFPVSQGLLGYSGA